MNSLERSTLMKQQAETILHELQTMERRARYDRVSRVGVLSFDLILTPDIDMAIYCPEVRIADGMTVLSECARHPQIAGAIYQNELVGPDKAVY